MLKNTKRKAGIKKKRIPFLASLMSQIIGSPDSAPPNAKTKPESGDALEQLMGPIFSCFSNMASNGVSSSAVVAPLLFKSQILTSSSSDDVTNMLGTFELNDKPQQAFACALTLAIAFESFLMSNKCKFPSVSPHFFLKDWNQLIKKNN